MLGGNCRKFLNDELGGGTVMGLLWLILLVSITGVAVDIINGSRTRTMLHATANADTAALDDAIDLPAPAAVVINAVAYSAGNIPIALYSSVHKAGVPEE
jgi:H+/gluconate symporter-like permease